MSEQLNIEGLGRTNSNIPITVRKLRAGGFILKAVDRKPGYTLFHVTRCDGFGNVQSYSFA